MKTHCYLRGPSRNRGLTLVELMVALIVSLLIAIAAVSSLVASFRGFSTVDASAQLRENARFAMDLLERMVGQAGFKDLPYSTSTFSNLPLSIVGYNNAKFQPSDASAQKTIAWPVQSGNGSDVLVIRYQGVRLNPESESASDFKTDGSMVDCAGSALKIGPNDRTVPAATAVYTSVFYISKDVDGEPALFCASQAPPLPPATALQAFNTPVALVRGVENFQVLYGVQAKVTSANAGSLLSSTADSVPYSYLRADQLTVGTTTSVQTLQNWKLVRSLRIGMVLRGPAGSQQERISQRLYPLGKAISTEGGAIGSAFVPIVANDDPGSQFDTPADGRFRQVVTFTLHLRNDQSL